jgi:hypothetical protein
MLNRVCGRQILDDQVLLKDFPRIEEPPGTGDLSVMDATVS